MPMAERFFNTSGPVVPADHYSIPPLERFDLDEVLRLIAGQALLRASRAAADGEDVGALGAARPAE